MLTGGSEKVNGQPQNSCWIIEDLKKTESASFAQYAAFDKQRSMIYRRFGHGLVPIYNCVYAVGGYMHRDFPGIEAMSVPTVERYVLHKNEWTEVARMEYARAFMGICPLQDQFIYVFGGLDGLRFLDTVERYDELLNQWTTFDVRMEVALAKIGCCNLSQCGAFTSILILGGVNQGYQRVDTVNIFEAQINVFRPVPGLKRPRCFNPGSGVFLV